MPPRHSRGQDLGSASLATVMTRRAQPERERASRRRHKPLRPRPGGLDRWPRRRAARSRSAGARRAGARALASYKRTGAMRYSLLRDRPPNARLRHPAGRTKTGRAFISRKKRWNSSAIERPACTRSPSIRAAEWHEVAAAASGCCTRAFQRRPPVVSERLRSTSGDLASRWRRASLLLRSVGNERQPRLNLRPRRTATPSSAGFGTADMSRCTRGRPRARPPRRRGRRVRSALSRRRGRRRARGERAPAERRCAGPSSGALLGDGHGAVPGEPRLRSRRRSTYGSIELLLDAARRAARPPDGEAAFDERALRRWAEESRRPRRRPPRTGAPDARRASGGRGGDVRRGPLLADQAWRARGARRASAPSSRGAVPRSRRCGRSRTAPTWCACGRIARGRARMRATR